MHDDPEIFTFPSLPDEAVVALNQFLETFYTHFQNHYFAQMHRHYRERPPPRDHDQMPPPLDDPPF